MKRVLVIGDVILDEYTHGNQLGLSAETPTIVAEWQKTERFVGGAGLVVRNLLRLGCQVILVTVTGPGESISTSLIESSDPPTMDEMNRLGYGPIQHEKWRLTQKKRFFVGPYKMVQYDIMNKGLYDQYLENVICEAFDIHQKSSDAVVVCDNRHGVMGYRLIDHIMKKRKRRDLKVYVDSQISQREGNHLSYFNCDALFLNEKEIQHVVYTKDQFLLNEEKIFEATKRTGTKIVLKMGPAGALSYDPKVGELESSDGFSVKTVDTCGAGDAFLAAYVAKDGDLEFANRWAALSTTYKGTFVPKIEDLERIRR